MANEKTHLEVGDIIYAKYQSPDIHKLTVVRTTKLYAVCENGIRFKRELLRGKPLRIGSYFHSYDCLPDPDIDLFYRKQLLIRKIKKIDLQQYSAITLELIYRQFNLNGDEQR
jgi:hypothetical protein